MKSSDAGNDERPQPQLVCWFCSARLRLDEVRRLSILRARAQRAGGPFRLFACPECQRHNQCESTSSGRWFSSPPFQPNMLDYLLGRLLLAGPEDFLRAMAWLRENGERRRHFFAREGDMRYGGRRLLDFLRGTLAGAPQDRSRPHDRPQGGDSSGARQRVERPRARGGIASPWAVLGVERGASEEVIRRAFHRLAVQVHPDKFHHLGEAIERTAHERFTELQKAYETLLSASRRAARDARPPPPGS